jgi:plasmid stabilization system protein ParE
MRVVLSEKADFDLVNIYRYLYEHNPSAADNFIQRVQANFENLASFPFIGRERSSLAPAYAALLSDVIWFSISSGPIQLRLFA